MFAALLTLTLKLNAAGDVVSLASATVNDVVDAVKTGVRSTTPAVEGSTIVPFLTPSLSPYPPSTNSKFTVSRTPSPLKS